MNVFTLPKHEWGEIVSHDPANNQFTLKKHYTFKNGHLPANPPKDTVISYTDTTNFLLEDSASTASEVLEKTGNWVQIHESRNQMLDVRSPASAYDPDELLDWKDGQRWHANDLTCPAIIEGYEIEDGEYNVHLRRYLNGKWERKTFYGRYGSGSNEWLDGKACNDPKTFIKPGRRVSIANSRNNKNSNLEIYYKSEDDDFRGEIKELKNGNTIVIKLLDWKGVPTGETVEVDIKNDATIWLDGQNSTISDAIKNGYKIRVYPERGRTIKGFKRHEPEGIVADLPPLPQVEIANPSDGVEYQYPVDTISVSANVSYADAAIQKVHLYKNFDLIAIDSIPPYETTLTDQPAGRFQLWAEVYAEDNTVGKSEPITININKSALFVTAQADTLAGSSPLTVNFSGITGGFGCDRPGDFIESDGTVVMEAEHFSDTIRNGDIRTWFTDTSTSGYTGSGYVTTNDVISTSDYNTAGWETDIISNRLQGCDVIYKIDFNTGGDYYVWFRRKIEDQGSNSSWVGLDGNYLGYFDNQFLQPYFDWQWRNEVQYGKHTIDTGLHSFIIRRRESQYKIDKIVLTTDDSFTPSGEGPSESSRYAAGCEWQWDFGDGTQATGKINRMNIEQDGQYQVVVTVSTATPGELARDTLNILVEDAVSISQNDAEVRNIQMYPTVTKGMVYVKGIKNQAKVTVISAFGNICQQKYIQSGKIDLSGLANGVYILQIQTENDKKRKKIIKIN